LGARSPGAIILRKVDVDPDRDAFLRRFVQEAGPGNPPAGACPDAATLAAHAEGRLLAAERGAVEDHLADCDSCRSVWRALATRAPERALQRRRRPAAAAAFLLCTTLAAGVVYWLATRGGAPPSRAETARTLRERHPDLLADLEPFALEDLAGGGAVPLRGGVDVLKPAGTVFELRPEILFSAQPGVASWRVTVATASGELLLTLEVPEGRASWPADQPPLTAGRTYLIEVAGHGPLGTARGSRTFTVASDAERERFERAAAVIRAEAPASTAELLVAELALHRGLLDQAEAAARAHVGLSPGEPFGTAVLERVTRERGTAGR
jgi:hypothetical protein